MPVFQLDDSLIFPPVRFAEPDGLLAVGTDEPWAGHSPDRFYRAIGDPTRRVRSAFPCVPHRPVHHAVPADRWKFDVVQSIRTLTLLQQAHPEKRVGGVSARVASTSQAAHG